MAKCWETRACDAEMQSRCPHDEPTDKCPAKCAFAVCERPTHVLTWDPALIFEPTIDRRIAIKELCTYCEFFLTHGPKMPESA
jgi:hypothetical protein